MFFTCLKNLEASQGIVVHTHNPNYSGGRDQEDLGSRPAWAKNF
jgi:hypothetical protein